MVLRRGMGLWPYQQCYDPTRSSLLPYWIQNFTEAACIDAKFPHTSPIDIPGPVAIPAPPAPLPPSGPDINLSNPVISSQDPAQTAQDVSNQQILAWQKQLADIFAEVPSDTSFWGDYGVWIAVAGVVAAAFFFAGRR